jgi:predicted TIM-barrel fold metal-dependent hydrolase
MDEHRRVVPTGLLDAHHHVWDLAVRDQPGTTQVPVLRRTFTADQLASHLEAAGVAATIVVQTSTVPMRRRSFSQQLLTRRGCSVWSGGQT